MKNTLQSRNFRFDIQQDGSSQNVADFLWQVVDVTVPSLILSETSISVPGISNLRNAGTTMTLGDLDIEFLMDSEYAAYTNLYQWIMAAHIKMDGNESSSSYKKDALLMILDSTQNDIVTAYKFYDMYPTNISPLSFSYGESGAIDAVTCTVTFSFQGQEMLDGTLNPIII